jgi:hypothetical protein
MTVRLFAPHTFGIQEVREGVKPSRFYGFAYYDPEQFDQVVYYPIPINLFVSLIRKTQARLIKGLRPDVFELEYQRGYGEGIKYQRELDEAKMESRCRRCRGL